MEKMRQQQMSERERLLEAKYKQIMFAEGIVYTAEWTWSWTWTLEMKFQAAEDSREFTKRAYLFCYSLAMFMGYFFILSKLVYGAVWVQAEYFSQSYTPNGKCKMRSSGVVTVLFL